MRFLFSLLVAVCTAVGNSACAEQATQGPVERTSAAHSALTAMFIDSGALDAAARGGFQQSGAEIWNTWSENPTFGQLDSAKRDAIRAYLLSEYPGEATAEVVSHAPAVIESMAPRLATLLEEQQLLDIENFVRSEGGRSWFLRTISTGAEVTPTARESLALDALARTSAGNAWTNEDFNQFVHDMLQQLIATRAPAIRDRLTFRICEILANDRAAWSACSE